MTFGRNLFTGCFLTILLTQTAVLLSRNPESFILDPDFF